MRRRMGKKKEEKKKGKDKRKGKEEEREGEKKEKGGKEKKGGGRADSRNDENGGGWLQKHRGWERKKPGGNPRV